MSEQDHLGQSTGSIAWHLGALAVLAVVLYPVAGCRIEQPAQGSPFHRPVLVSACGSGAPLSPLLSGESEVAGSSDFGQGGD
ncbi:hypothetical protein [Streptomyces nigra]|uniref:hypothetical protein n=1 Tax=Streptomyces nigra TaxID=1827580 RepID=UPI0036316B48